MSSSVQFVSQSNAANAFLYRDVGAPMEMSSEATSQSDAKAEAGKVGPSAEEVAQWIANARSEAETETTACLNALMDERLAEQAGKVKQSLQDFIEERKTYFARVESDVVHLSLAIAAKILHREAQVDSMLVATLVRMAVNKLHDGSQVSVRVGSSDVQHWSALFAESLKGVTIRVIEDANLAAGDCVLETDLGSANFGIEAQLKEIEQGFFDLLAQRPAVR